MPPPRGQTAAPGQSGCVGEFEYGLVERMGEPRVAATRLAAGGHADVLARRLAAELILAAPAPALLGDLALGGLRLQLLPLFLGDGFAEVLEDFFGGPREGGSRHLGNEARAERFRRRVAVLLGSPVDETHDVGLPRLLAVRTSRGGGAGRGINCVSFHFSPELTIFLCDRRVSDTPGYTRK